MPIARSGSEWSPRRIHLKEADVVKYGFTVCLCALFLWDASLQSREVPAGGLCVVLGAGNQNFLTGVDVIERAFMHKECVLLKQHPIRPFMAAPFEHIFQPLLNFRTFGMVFTF